jgi:hypothetical protein
MFRLDIKPSEGYSNKYTYIYVETLKSIKMGLRSPDSLLGVATELRAGLSGGSNSKRKEDVSVLQNLYMGSGVHPALCSVGTDVNGLGITIYLRLVRRL